MSRAAKQAGGATSSDSSTFTEDSATSSSLAFAPSQLPTRCLMNIAPRPSPPGLSVSSELVAVVNFERSQKQAPDLCPDRLLVQRRSRGHEQSPAQVELLSQSREGKAMCDASKQACVKEAPDNAAVARLVAAMERLRLLHSLILQEQLFRHALVKAGPDDAAGRECGYGLPDGSGDSLPRRAETRLCARCGAQSGGHYRSTQTSISDRPLLLERSLAKLLQEDILNTKDAGRTIDVNGGLSSQIEDRRLATLAATLK